MTDDGHDMSTPGTPVESEDRPPPLAQRQPDPAPTTVGARRVGLGPAWLRALLALPAFIVVGTLAAVPVVFALGLAAPARTLILAMGAASATACIAFVLAAWHLTSGAPLRALGLQGPSRHAARRFGAGVGAGLALMAIIVGVGVLGGAWQLRPGLPSSLEFITTTAVLLLASFWEELGFRGMILQEAGRRRLALGLGWSTLAFTFVHLGNPGALDTAAARILVPTNVALAAVLLGATFLLAGDLWWPWGLHFGWNWAQACVFGLPVSGFELPSLLRGTASERHPWLTGSTFGPEASVIATITLGCSVAVLGVLIRRRRPMLPLVAFDRAHASHDGSPIEAASG